MHPALKAFVRSEVAAEKRRQIKAWAAALPGTAGLGFSVNEIRCSDPGCPDVETVILVMADGCATRRARIARPLDAVTLAQVRDAIAAVLAPSAPPNDTGERA